ncbi:MAG: cytochrome b/b6 domain-containing protein [Burkholderiaceae bacterium]|nr:cytochrome b/b6 domain-containing protein [Burkholderiaceae bacterium]
MSQSPESGGHPVRVWDLPTRLFHWSLALCVVGSIVSAKIGGNLMDWHMRLGYAAFTLLLFRILWGLVGGRWSRFASFIYSPQALLRYLRGRPLPGDHFEVGHSPLGALSVFGLLAILAAQVGTGLFADDEIATTGPLIRFVSGATSSLLTGYHKHWGQWIIYALVALHVLAILFYVFKRGKALVRPMLVGDKLLSTVVPASRDGTGPRLLALVLLLACAGFVAWLIGLGAQPGF